MNYRKKVLNRDKLLEAVAVRRKSGARIVQCDGVFDILHPGHFRHLVWAKEQGDVLVVSLRPDAIVRRTIPSVLNESRRAENLAALEVVDFAIIDEGDWVGPLLDAVKPDVYVKGAEFEAVQDGLFGAERERVEAYGGELRFGSGDRTYSASELPTSQGEKGPDPEEVQSYCERHAITTERMDSLFEAFAGKRIVVVGEAIVDEYVTCDPLGMSADSPTLVVRPRSRDKFLGGAGIVAQHVKSLGADSHFITVVGDDDEGKYVRAELEAASLSFDLVVDPTRPTIHKKRFIAEGKKMLNVNVFRDQDLSAGVAAETIAAIEKAVAKADALIISDFSYGVVSPAVLEVLVREGRKKGIPVLGDVQSSSQIGKATRIQGVTVTTPSEREARLALWDREGGIADLGVRMLQETRNECIVVTLGKRGVMVVDSGGKSWDEIHLSGQMHTIKQHLTIDYLPSLAANVIDSMGAGDALLSAMTCVLAGGGSIMEAAFLGSCSSSVAVGHMGNIPVSRASVQAVCQSRLRLA